METTITDIIKEFREKSESLDVGALSQFRVKLSGEYAYYSSMLSDIEIEKAGWWETNRNDQKSDASTEKAWELTRNGKRQIKLKHLLRSTEKMISAIKTRIDVLINEKNTTF
jgi:hypothetical protein